MSLPGWPTTRYQSTNAIRLDQYSKRCNGYEPSAHRGGGVRIVGSLGDVGSHWCGRARRGVWRGVLGGRWIVAASTWVCVLAESPPGGAGRDGRGLGWEVTDGSDVRAGRRDRCR